MVASPRKRTSTGASAVNGKGSKKAPVEVVDTSDAEMDEVIDADEEEDEEPEYEIEAIRDHRGQAHDPGHIEYLIKWKGYPEKDNTWEPEDNAKNSQQIIDAYWKTVPSKSQVNKYEKKLKTKSGRHSAAQDSDAEDDGAVSAGYRDAEDESDKELQAPAAKKRRSVGRASKKAETEESEIEEVDDEDKEALVKEINDELSRKYKKMDDWESLVERVETMERGEDEVLMARLVFKRDKEYSRRMKEIGALDEDRVGPELWVKEIVASKKCPQKVLKFYRDHLRFSRPNKEAEEVEDEEGEE